MPQFPAGTVTFLFSDIEKSTSLWERDAAAARAIVERHLEIIGLAVEASGGVLFKTIGDGTQSAFPTATRGIAAALAGQRALIDEPWPSPEARPRVRMALHTGAAEPRNGDYLAPCLNRLARLLDAAHGEQILLSQTVAGLAGEELPAQVTIEALGEYRLRDILQAEAVFQLRHPALRADFPPLTSPGHLPHNLPAHPTPFLGRERDVGEVVALLMRPEVRLVTLTGPGGVGKTRLALRVAAEALESFPDGAFLVDLARQTDPALVPAAAATALGLREQAGQTPAETLAGYLRERRILLLFDNFEHLLPAATLLSDLIATAPGLTVLATSRARLGLQAEHEYRVETLPVPDLAALPPLVELETYDAIALFVSRAKALRPEFALTEENAPTIAAICERVDGLPLAIELAAVRVKILSPEALLQRLDDRLATLTGGARDLPTRQRTVRDTIAWSHDLLAPEEAMLFRRLSIFVGGWTLEGAEAMGKVAAGEIADTLSVLAGLVDQSLVDEWPGPAATTDEPRYGMLETIREFAGEQLEASRELDDARQAFGMFLVGLAEKAEAGLRGADQVRWLDRLEAEHTNIRAAIGLVGSLRGGDIPLRLAAHLWPFWMLRGYLGEGRSWLERLLASAPSADAELTARAEFGLGKLCSDLGDYAAAEGHFRACIGLRRELADMLGVAEALSELAVVAHNVRTEEEARALGDQALQIFREQGDVRGTAKTLHGLGIVARGEGDYTRARRLFEESMASWRTLNEPSWTATVALGLGFTHRLEGNFAAAKTRLDEAQGLYAHLGDPFGLAVVAMEMGQLARDVGEISLAIALYGEALRSFAAIGAAEAVVYCLEYLADSAVAANDPEIGLRLFGAAEAARTALRLAPPDERDVRLVAKGIESATRAIGEVKESPLAAGRALTLEQARDEGLGFAAASASRLPAASNDGREPG